MRRMPSPPALRRYATPPVPGILNGERNPALSSTSGATHPTLIHMGRLVPEGGSQRLPSVSPGRGLTFSSARNPTNRVDDFPGSKDRDSVSSLVMSPHAS